MRKPSSATVLAAVALFVALGGAGIAANGQGLILGQSNTATSNTSLSAPVAGGKTLQLTNNDTSNPASNALGLNVAPNHAPFTVNTGVKVTNLNADRLDGFDSTYFLPKAGKAADADKLDGVDSTGFMQGAGRSNSAALELQPSNNTTEYALLSVPGLGGFSAKCYTVGSTSQGDLFLNNGSGGAIYASEETMTLEGAGYPATPYATARRLLPGEGVVLTWDNSHSGAMAQMTWQLNPATGFLPVATVVTSQMFYGSDCVFRASYVENG